MYIFIYIYVFVGPAQTDRCRSPRLLPAAGLHPAVQVLHCAAPPPPPAQSAASAAQPQGGAEVRANARHKASTQPVEDKGYGSPPRAPQPHVVG